MFELGLHWQANIKQSCLDRHVFYSPALEEIEITYRPVQFNGSLDYPSPFRGYPTSEIDAAWDSITELGLMSVSAQQVIESRQSIDSVRFPPEVGDGGYIASVEVAHQLHCLNFLRKQSYFDYYKDKSIEYTDEPATIRDHLDHCIEMLRQTLMCNADIGIIVHEWVEHYPRPYPNFNTWHQCRNFDDIMDWIRGRHIPQKPPNGDEWPKLPGSKTFPTPP
ncbi:hypothetical protein PENOC_106480 [Penicillium occitanis (nom. inval.)]|nr:hypothetical protein PENOC_106480 [Penicillium occitanis (nom. inval.)]